MIWLILWLLRTFSPANVSNRSQRQLVKRFARRCEFDHNETLDKTNIKNSSYHSQNSIDWKKHIGLHPKGSRWSGVIIRRQGSKCHRRNSENYYSAQVWNGIRSICLFYRTKEPSKQHRLRRFSRELYRRAPFVLSEANLLWSK